MVASDVSDARPLPSIDELLAAGEGRTALWPRSIAGIYALGYAMMAHADTIERSRDVSGMFDQAAADAPSSAWPEMRTGARSVMRKRMLAKDCPVEDLAFLEPDDQDRKVHEAQERARRLKVEGLAG